MKNAYVVYLHTVKNYSVMKREILPFVTTWRDTEGTTLGEISQKEKREIPYDFTLMWNLKQKQNKQTKTNLYIQTTDKQSPEDQGAGGVKQGVKRFSCTVTNGN